MDSPQNSPLIEAFFDPATNTISYLVADPVTRDAAVIDPVLDFSIESGEADTRSAEKVLATAAERGWRIVMVLETHAHADHLSAAPWFKARTGASIGIGEHIRDVQKIFRPMFAFDDMIPDGATRLFLCHDYKAPGREDYRWETTVDEQRRTSVHVNDDIGEETFVKMRDARDATLAVPKLLLPSIQVNIRAGHFPEAEENGVRFLRIPVKGKSGAVG
jgi:hypothetical protein